MRFMRPVTIIAILLILMLLLAGCGQRVPLRNATTKSSWNKTPAKGIRGSGTATTPVPTTTSPFKEVPITQEVTLTPTTGYRGEPPTVNVTANLSIIDQKKLVLNGTPVAYTYTLKRTPLLIDITLTVPNITRERVWDEVTGKDEIRTITYPDPSAWFEATVKDLETNRIIAQGGYGREYDVSFRKKIWVRYPGDYYIEFAGTRVTADVKFFAPKEE